LELPINLWHNIAMDRDAEIVIVEKSNTHLGDFIYREINKKEEDYLKNAISMLLK